MFMAFEGSADLENNQHIAKMAGRSGKWQPKL
jgi:hypothetical protein